MKPFRLLLIFLFLFSVAGWSQTISFSVDQQPLEKVILLIEKQSDHRFIYSSEAMAQSRPLSLRVNNEMLSTVLVLCFKDQPLTYTMTANKHIIVRLKTTDKPVPSTREFRGKVLHENGEPAAGVTLAIKHSGLVTVSDTNGEFVFPNAPGAVTLLVSGAEMESQEIDAGVQLYVVVRVRQKMSALDETIVIAYGNTTRRTSTGTVSKVSGADIGKQPVSNLAAGLSGRVSGLQITQGSGLPGTNFTIRLRGQNSIANGNDPLYLVDGVPFPSTSLSSGYGGGGGGSASPLNFISLSDIESIEILKDADATAIYGSRGANGVILITTKRGKPGETKVDVKCYTGVGKVTRFLPLMNTAQYLAMRREAFANDGVLPTPTNARDLLVWDTSRYTDWQDVLIGETVHINDLNFRLSGGSPQTQFLFSTGYHKESTILPGDFGEEKLTGALSLTHHSRDNRFSFNASTHYLRNLNLLPNGDISTAITLPPNAPRLYTNDGKLNWENSTWTNPYATLLKKYKTTADHFSANLVSAYLFAKGLEGRISLGYSSISSKEHITNPAAAFDPAQPVTASAGFASNTISTFITEPQLSYKASFGQWHIQLLGGATLQQNEQTALTQTGNGYLSDDLLHSLKAAATISIGTDMITKYRYAGIFARANVDLDHKYYLTLTGRKDGSSRYGPANRFAYFGSAGAGWIFSKEKWMRSLKFLSYGKLKGSAGVTGNDQIGDYKYLDTYSPYTNTYMGGSTLYPTQLYNPAFGWERVQKLEAGIELGFLTDRFLITANYYHNTTGNQLVSYALPTLTGFTGILRNLPARILNNGWEFEIIATVLEQKNWKWRSVLNLSIPRNKLLAFEGIARSSYANTYVVGQSLFISKRYHYTGINPSTGNYSFEDTDGDNRISFPNDQRDIIFTGQPYYGGWQNEVSYGRFSLQFLVQFVRQPHSANFMSRFPKPGSLTNQPVYVLDRWRKVGDEALYQKYSVTNSENNTAFTNYRLSDAALTDASFIRLKNLHASWQLPATLTRKPGISSCEIFIQGQNLVTISGYKGLDPETKAVVPPLKIITAGIHLTF